MAAATGALFGFSTECFAITESFFYGPAYGLAYWINGLTFDLVHGVSNFIIILLLYKPLRKMMDTSLKHYYNSAS